MKKKIYYRLLRVGKKQSSSRSVVCWHPHCPITESHRAEEETLMEQRRAGHGSTITMSGELRGFSSGTPQISDSAQTKQVKMIHIRPDFDLRVQTHRSLI